MPRIGGGQAPFVLFIVLLSLLWGANVVFIKIAADLLPPLYMASFRFFIAAGVLVFYLRWRGSSIVPVGGQYHAFLTHGFLFALQIGFFYLGLFRTSASHAAMLVHVHVFMVALLAHFFLPHDRLTPRKGAGLVVAFLGIFTLFSDSARGNIPSIRGDLLILLSAAALAIKTVLIKKEIHAMDPVTVVLWQMVFGAPLMLVWGVFLGEALPRHIPLRLGISLLYQGLISGAFCFSAITVLLKHYRASHIAAFFTLVPLFGVLLSHLYLGDRLTLHFIAGGVLIGIGLALATISKPSSILPRQDGVI